MMTPRAAGVTDAFIRAISERFGDACDMSEA